MSLNPETQLMNAILGEYRDDDDYYEALNGVSLHDALMGTLESLQRRRQDSYPKRKRIILLRFGFEDGRSHTLREIGKEFGLTGERICQLEAKTLRLLRHHTRSGKLKPFIKERNEYQGR